MLYGTLSNVLCKSRFFHISWEVSFLIWEDAGKCFVLQHMKCFILFLVQWDNEQSPISKEPGWCLLPSLPEAAWSLLDAPQPLHNTIGSKKFIQMFLRDAIPRSGFHGLLCLLCPLPYLYFSRSQTDAHAPVLPPSPCTCPESPLRNILPAGLCKTGAMQQRPRACCVKGRGVFIWGKTRLGLLTKLVKSGTWHFALLQRLPKYKVCWALWNENIVQWLTWW